MNTTELPTVTPDAPEAQPDYTQEARRAYSRSMLNLALYALIGTVLVFIVGMAILIITRSDELSTAINYIVSFAPMYLIAFPLYLLLSKPLPVTPPERHSMHFGELLLAFLMMEGIAIAGNLIGVIFNALLSAIVGVDTASDFVSDGVFGDSGMLFICIAVLCAPFIEEMLFRKVLIDRVRKYGDGTAILLSGLLFGLFHGNFSQFFYAAGLGLLFAFIYVRTGKIQYTITLHFMMNFCGSFIPLLVLKDIDLDAITSALETNDFAAITGLLGQMIPLFVYEFFVYGFAIAGVVLLIVNRKKFQIAPPIAPIPRGKRLKTVCLNLGFWVLVLFCAFEFVMAIVENIPIAE